MSLIPTLCMKKIQFGINNRHRVLKLVIVKWRWKLNTWWKIIFIMWRWSPSRINNTYAVIWKLLFSQREMLTLNQNTKNVPTYCCRIATQKHKPPLIFKPKVRFCICFVRFSSFLHQSTSISTPKSSKCLFMIEWMMKTWMKMNEWIHEWINEWRKIGKTLISTCFACWHKQNVT